MRVEMDYQDANGETLTASQQIPLYPSAIQLGVKTDGWMMKQDDLRLKFVALDTDGKPAKGRKVSVAVRSEEHTSELQSLIRISYAVFCLKKKKHNITGAHNRTTHPENKDQIRTQQRK